MIDSYVPFLEYVARFLEHLDMFLNNFFVSLNVFLFHLCPQPTKFITRSKDDSITKVKKHYYKGLFQNCVSWTLTVLGTVCIRPAKDHPSHYPSQEERGYSMNSKCS